jgi:energy-coupling factor transporter ATP-binding protein EcfA2
MSVSGLRTQISHQLAVISDIHILEEINAMLDLKNTEQVYRCTEEQRRAIFEVQEAMKRGESVSNKEVKQAVEICLIL